MSETDEQTPPAGDGVTRAEAAAGRRDLAGAGLQGADLRSADLAGADLSGANLSRANLAGANLRKSNLEQADLGEADLIGCDLRGARAGKANLRGALLEEAALGGAMLRFADLRGAFLDKSDLRGADLWGANLEGAAAAGADLRGGDLTDARLKGADLTGVSLRGAKLRGADLRGAKMAGADLEEADLAGADLRGAVLTNARLSGVDLSKCRIEHPHFDGAWLDNTRLGMEQLGGAAGEELAGDYGGAAGSYFALERNFTGLGDADASGWAYRRRRRMQKLAARSEALRLARRRQFRRALPPLGKYAGSLFVEWLCDYGESVGRVMAAILLVYLAFAAGYGLTGSVVRLRQTPAGVAHEPTHRPIDLAVFSLTAMTTSTGPADLQARNAAVHLVAGVQSMLGIALTGLLGFVIGNRIRR